MDIDDLMSGLPPTPLRRFDRPKLELTLRRRRQRRGVIRFGLVASLVAVVGIGVLVTSSDDDQSVVASDSEQPQRPAVAPRGSATSTTDSTDGTATTEAPHPAVTPTTEVATTTSESPTPAPAPVTIYVRYEDYEEGAGDIAIDLLLDGIRVRDRPIVVGRSDASATFSTTFPVGQHELTAIADGEATTKRIVVSSDGNWIGVVWVGREAGPDSLQIDQYEEPPFFG